MTTGNKLILVLLVILLLCPIASAKGSGSSNSSNSSSSRSYSSGSTTSSSSRSSSSTGRSYSSGTPSKPATNSTSRSYSSGTSSNSTTISSRPTQPKFDTLGREDKFKSDNRARYDRGTQPQSSYKTTSGQTKNIDINNKTVQATRTNITEEKWTNRSTRINTTFNNYTVIGANSTVLYHDNYNIFFWLWLLDRSADERAMWAYHHQVDLDARRMEELRRKDAELDVRLKRLEGQSKNGNYSPKGIEEDLMYTDNYVDAVYNPHPKEFSENHTNWSAMGYFCLGTMILVVVGLAIYAIFFYRAF